MTNPIQAQPEWTTTTTPQELAGWLKGAANIAILTHARPDGDAIGSSVALARALNHATKSKRAHIYFAGGAPRWADDIIADTPHTHTDAAHPFPDSTPDFDRIVIVDTGSWSQLDTLADFVKKHEGITAVVDHHLSGDAEISPRRILATTAAAACEPVAQICQHILGLESATAFPVSVARPLYLGLATDTGFFKYSNVKPSTLRLAADLLQAGVDHAALHALIELNEVPARLRMVAAALSSLELLDRERIAIMTIRTADIHAAKAGPADTGGLAGHALTIGSVRVSATVTEVETADDTEATKISMRSKPGPHMIDVNKIAQSLGGGGHANAAGAKLSCSVDEAKAKLIKALTQ